MLRCLICLKYSGTIYKLNTLDLQVLTQYDVYTKYPPPFFHLHVLHFSVDVRKQFYT
jgi:hypothetical protein